MGIFSSCTFCVKVKHLPRQQKIKLQTDIKENGGNVSFLLNPQVFANFLRTVSLKGAEVAVGRVSSKLAAGKSVKAGEVTLPTGKLG